LFDVGSTDAIRVGAWLRPVVASTVFLVLLLVAALVYFTRSKRGKR